MRYADPTANKLMAKSIVSPTTAAIQKEVGYFAKQQPVLYFPVQDYIMAISNKVGGSTAGFLEMTQQQISSCGALYLRQEVGVTDLRRLTATTRVGTGRMPGPTRVAVKP